MEKRQEKEKVEKEKLRLHWPTKILPDLTVSRYRKREGREREAETTLAYALFREEHSQLFRRRRDKKDTKQTNN